MSASAFIAIIKIGTREHVGTPKSYLSIYNTLFYIYPFFNTKICMKMGFLVFHVFQVLKIRRC